MKPTFLTIVLISVVLFFSSLFCVAADAQGFVPVASYTNRPPFNAGAARAYAILNAKKIVSVTAESAGATILVRADRAAEALQLLAKAIKAEKLDLTLVVLKGDRYVTVTPDSILEPKKAE